MMQSLSGGCRCGQVRYQGVATGGPMFRCHCRDCQQLTGSGHADMVPLSVESFSITGPVKTFEMIGGSGQPTFSGFCSNCGSQIARRSQRMSDRIYVHAASLDDPSHHRPQKSLHSGAVQPWDEASIIKD